MRTAGAGAPRPIATAPFETARVPPARMSAERLPDFFIGGAMKSGTSTLHALLARRPDVFMPRQELHFFSMDDVVQHPDLASAARGRVPHVDYERDLDTNLDWYAAQFGAARPDQRVGEHATTYLPSARVAPRIARLLPHARIIFLLRDPVRRALSHYWHTVRSGRAIYGFEKTIRYAPHTILTRGFYRESLEVFYRHFPREQIRVVIFEQFIADVPAAFREIERFLGLDPPFDIGGLPVHEHRGDAPRFPQLRLMQNRVLRGATTVHRLPVSTTKGDPAVGRRHRLALGLDRALRDANPPARRYADARPETVAFLQELFARENAGLSGLIGADVARYWPYMR